MNSTDEIIIDLILFQNNTNSCDLINKLENSTNKSVISAVLDNSTDNSLIDSFFIDYKNTKAINEVQEFFFRLDFYNELIFFGFFLFCFFCCFIFSVLRFRI